MRKFLKISIHFCLIACLLMCTYAEGEIEIFEIAATSGVSEVKAILNTVTDINMRDNSGMTVLMWAAWKNPNLEVIKVIIDAGADVGIKDNNGNTALDFAKKDLSYNKIKSEYYKLLWTKDTTLPKNSYFVELCGTGTASEVMNAISNGANVNAEDRYGISPIFWAAWLNSDVGVITALLESGANPNISYVSGKTPLIMAAGDNENPEVIIALLNGGADAKMQDALGKKAVDYAEWNRGVRRTKAYSMLRQQSN